MFDNLTIDNIMLYLIKAYDSPNMIISEFEEDMLRFNYIKKLLCRHKNNKNINVNLLLNHIIILCNVFGVEVTVRSLFYKFNDIDYTILKPILLFLNIMPPIIFGIKGKNILSSDISLDTIIVEKLRVINAH